MSGRVKKIRFWVLLGAVSLALSVAGFVVTRHSGKQGWPRTDVHFPGRRGVVVGPDDVFMLIYDELRSKGLDAGGSSGNRVFAIDVPEADADRAVAIVRRMAPRLKAAWLKVRETREKWSDLETSWPPTDRDPPGRRKIAIAYSFPGDPPGDPSMLIFDELESNGIHPGDDSEIGSFYGPFIDVPEADAERAVAIIRRIAPKLKGHWVKVRETRDKWSDLE